MAVALALLVSWMKGRVGEDAPTGRATGALAGRPTSVVIGLTEGDLPDDERAAAAGGAQATVVIAAGPDGITGSDDDVVVPAGPRGTVPEGQAGGGPDVTGPGDSDSAGGGSPSNTLPAEPHRLGASTIDAPAPAPDAVDGCGTTVSFPAGHLLDGQRATAWRTEGDATGQTVTLTLEGSRHVTSVGLVPGFALVDACDGSDRFAQNRRVTRVTWTFDDGTSVAQDLGDAAELQTVPVDARTDRVSVRIEGVTGDPERDFTAISEIDVRGS